MRLDTGVGEGYRLALNRSRKWKFQTEGEGELFSKGPTHEQEGYPQDSEQRGVIPLQAGITPRFFPA